MIKVSALSGVSAESGKDGGMLVLRVLEVPGLSTELEMFDASIQM